MIIYLFGPNFYRRQQKLKEILNNYKEKYSVFSVENFELEDASELGRLKDYCRQESLFAVKKMAIVKNASELNAENKKELKELLKIFTKNENTVIILSQDKNFPKEFDFLLNETFQEFPELDSAKMEYFINKEATMRGLKLDTKTISFLARIFNKNTWGLITEIEKLANLENPNFAKIKSFVFWTERGDIFDFSGTISRKKPLEQKLISLEKLLVAMEEPAKIFNFAAASPFLTFELLEKMANYDVAVKSGKLDYDLALLDLCLN